MVTPTLGPDDPVVGCLEGVPEGVPTGFGGASCAKAVLETKPKAQAAAILCHKDEFLCRAIVSYISPFNHSTKEQ